MLTFRKAASTDVPILRSLAKRIWRACYPSIIGSEQVEYMLTKMYAARVILREIDTGVHWELATERGEEAGFLSITAGTEDRAKLNKLYLIPELHGLGFGQHLIDHACESAARLGARELWLQVNKRNERAIRAYARAGFAVEKEAIFDIGNGFVMDDYIMSRALDLTTLARTQ